MYKRRCGGVQLLQPATGSENGSVAACICFRLWYVLAVTGITISGATFVQDTVCLSTADVMDIAMESRKNRTSMRSILRRREGVPGSKGPSRLREAARLSKMAKTISMAGGCVDARWRVQVLPRDAATWESMSEADDPQDACPDYSIHEQTVPFSGIPANLTFDLEDVPISAAINDSISDEEDEDARLLAQMMMEKDVPQWDNNLFVQVWRHTYIP